ALRFKKRDGRDVIAAWSTAADDNWQVRLQSDRPPRKPVTVRAAGEAPITRTWGQRRHEKSADGVTRTVVDAGALAVTVRDTPVLIEGDLGDIADVSVKQIPFPETLRGTRGYANIPE